MKKLADFLETIGREALKNFSNNEEYMSCHEIFVIKYSAVIINPLSKHNYILYIVASSIYQRVQLSYIVGTNDNTSIIIVHRPIGAIRGWGSCVFGPLSGSFDQNFGNNMQHTRNFTYCKQKFNCVY